MNLRELALKDTNTEALKSVYHMFCETEEQPKGFFARLFRRRPDISKMSPVELVCWLERLERWAGMVKMNMRVPANAAYNNLKARSCSADPVKSPVPWATLAEAPEITSWMLPTQVLEQQLAAVAAVELAKKSGVATKSVGQRDPQHELLFKVGLNKC